MNKKILIFLNLLVSAVSLVPIWNLKNFSIDLLNNGNIFVLTKEYSRMYDLKITMKKNITKSDGKITHENTVTITQYSSNTDNTGSVIVPETRVEYESIESFYKLTDLKLICPSRNFNPINLNNNMNEYVFNNWTKDDYWDLKCYYHRTGFFLVYYLINGNNEIQAFKESTKTWVKYDNIQIYDEIYDFKLVNKEDNENGPFAFMALIKDKDYIKIFGSKYNFGDGISLEANTTKELIQAKSNTKAYFKSSDNNFYYFTYNNVSDF